MADVLVAAIAQQVQLRLVGGRITPSGPTQCRPTAALSKKSESSRSLWRSASSVFLRGDVHQHVDAADDVAVGVAQRRGIGLEPDANAVGTLGDGLGAADNAAFLQSDGHRTLVVRHGLAVGVIQLPRHTPPVGAQLRLAA